jgi:hypothetical protein
VVNTLGCKPECRGFETRRGEILNLPNTSGRTSPWCLLRLWQKWIPETLKKMFVGSKVRLVRGLAIFPPSVSHLSRQCGILNISQSYRPVTGIVLLLFLFLSELDFRKIFFCTWLQGFLSSTLRVYFPGAQISRPTDLVFYRVGQTQLGSFWSLITNQSNNTRENGKVPCNFFFFWRPEA